MRLLRTLVTDVVPSTLYVPFTSLDPVYTVEQLLASIQVSSWGVDQPPV